MPSLEDTQEFDTRAFANMIANRNFSPDNLSPEEMQRMKTAYKNLGHHTIRKIQAHPETGEIELIFRGTGYTVREFARFLKIDISAVTRSAHDEEESISHHFLPAAVLCDALNKRLAEKGINAVQL